MKRVAVLLFGVAMVIQHCHCQGANIYTDHEPPAQLIVEPPLPDLLAQGIAGPWRGGNVHIGPVLGKNALNVSPRVGHLHIHVDDLPLVVGGL